MQTNGPAPQSQEDKTEADAAKGVAALGLAPLREAFLVWLSITLTAFIGFCIIFVRARNYESNSMENELKGMALIAANLVDGDRMRELTDDAQTGGELYRDIVDPLVRFHRSVPSLFYVFTVRMVDEKVHYVLGTSRYVYDMRPGASLLRSRVMQPYERPDPALVDTLKHHHLGVTKKNSINKFGVFKGAYAPVYDGKHEAAGAVGVVLDMKEYNARIDEVLAICLGEFLIVVFLTTIVAVFIYRSRSHSLRHLSRMYDRQASYREEIEEKNRKNEELLANILPPDVARRLKQGEKIIADQHERVTVMFIDLLGFTRFSSPLTAQEVVNFLNRVFSRFDELVLRYKLEKIKTIGDCYMVVGGLAPLDGRHMRRAAMMALDVVAIFSEIAKEEPDAVGFDIRIGIATGPVVSGVIGNMKFAFDLWGDTVNTASRMESHSYPGKIQCNADFVQYLQKEFIFEDRGEIDVRSKGMMRTWFLVGAKPGASSGSNPGVEVAPLEDNVNSLQKLDGGAPLENSV
jgi:class 3 adenylate cyclase